MPPRHETQSYKDRISSPSRTGLEGALAEWAADPFDFHQKGKTLEVPNTFFVNSEHQSDRILSAMSVDSYQTLLRRHMGLEI
jgi:hypothetical protein